MADWKKTDYGTPDTWAEQQQRKRHEEVAKDGYSPFPALLHIGFWVAVVIACVIGTLAVILR